MCACQFVRPRETARFPLKQTCVIFYAEKSYRNSVEKIQIELIPDINIRQFTALSCRYDEEHPYVKTWPACLRQTALSQAEGIYCVGWELSDRRPCACSHVDLCFIVTGIRQETIVSPMKWNMLPHFNRHG